MMLLTFLELSPHLVRSTETVIFSLFVFGWTDVGYVPSAQVASCKSETQLQEDTDNGDITTASNDFCLPRTRRCHFYTKVKAATKSLTASVM